MDKLGVLERIRLRAALALIPRQNGQGKTYFMQETCAANPGDRPHSVAIVARGSGWQSAPWGKEGYEIWGFNDRDELDPPIECYTRWFQLHNPDYCARHYPSGLWNLQRFWGERTGVPLYMDRHHREYPDSTAFPKAQIEATFPRGRYHVSTFDWLLAFAILRGFRRVEFYGAYMPTGPIKNGEPMSGRPCLEYWIGLAEGRGMTTYVHSVPGYMQTMFKAMHVAVKVSDAQYGFDDEPSFQLDDGWHDWR